MKRLHILMLAAVLALCMPATAFAEHLTGAAGWAVTYTADGALQDNYSAGQFADEVGSLLPGDDISLAVSLQHQNDQAGDWYMANQVLKSLEEGAAAGSAYGYRLTYTGPDGAVSVLYDSDAVGGDDSRGLIDATAGLQDFFYLGTLEKGQAATVQLQVSLDGETEGNAYFNTLAQLQMSFAVQPEVPESLVPQSTGQASSSSSAAAPASEPSKPRTVAAGSGLVQTGDPLSTLPLFVAMIASGAVLLVLGVRSLRLRRKDEQEAGR